MEKSYITTKKESEFIFKEKKSEFIGRVFPVKSESDCISILTQIKKKHYDATHNCYAYILGSKMEIQRSSDDGEPSGTAGLPILEVLRKNNLTFTLIIVTRYFGGILLGSGGLIRAYSHAASEPLHEAEMVKVAPSNVYKLSCDYTYLEKLKYELPKMGYTILDIEFSNFVILKVTSPENISGPPDELYAGITGGTGIIEDAGIMNVEIPLF